MFIKAVLHDTRNPHARARFGGLMMSTPWNDRCTGCQVGQGRSCACRDAKPKRRELTPTEATWLVLLADVAFLFVVVLTARACA